MLIIAELILRSGVQTRYGLTRTRLAGKSGHPSNNLPFKPWHPGFGRTLEQFEKDSKKWEKLSREITQR